MLLSKVSPFGHFAKTSLKKTSSSAFPKSVITSTAFELELLKRNMEPTYTVTLPEWVQELTIEREVTLPQPDHALEEGQILTVMKPFSTNTGHSYHQGDKLTLLRRTNEAPYGFSSSLGNWEVECPHKISVWSDIEAMVATGEVSESCAHLETVVKQPQWVRVEDAHPEPFEEVLVWIDGHRGPSWRNSHALVAYRNDEGQWRQERHPNAEELVGVLAWKVITEPEF